MSSKPWYSSLGRLAPTPTFWPILAMIVALPGSRPIAAQQDLSPER